MFSLTTKLFNKLIGTAIIRLPETIIVSGQLQSLN
jgi:hypothetical protein